MMEKKQITHQKPVTIVVLGASGDLARKKIFPALFALYSQGYLPESFHVIGYARSSASHEEFRNKIIENLTCRYVPEQDCAQKMEDFLNCCFYQSGQYDSPESFQKLSQFAQKLENHQPTNRVFYMSIPPFLFLQVAHSLSEAGLITGSEDSPWSRVVIEKPFGSDRPTSDQLVEALGKVFSEDQTYRIDHYLGKEVIQNLLVLRFANLIFDPIWSRNCIDHVRISWKEDIGVGERGGYFDEYGIIRDVIQNHLFQILALIAMEQPVSLDAHDIRDEKVKVLRSIPPVRREDIIIGQYSSANFRGKQHPGYLEETGIPVDSTTPTYAAAVVYVRNRRWDGVPFLIQAGKGLNTRETEIRLRFRNVPGNIFCSEQSCLPANEFVIRVQPDESISFIVVNKVPGLKMELAESELDLRYAHSFGTKIPDAYECLLLDVLEGDKSLFIRSDELAAAWDIFTPVLHELDRQKEPPLKYPFGSHGPTAILDLAAKHGIELNYFGIPKTTP